MIKKVVTKEELEIFKEIWYEACDDMEYESEPFAEDGVCYLLINKEGIPIGTAEIIPYKPNKFSTVEKYHSYLGDKRVSENLGYVYEMDKASISKKHRRQGHIIEMLDIIRLHSEEYGGKYYIGFMEEKFYRAARFVYKTGLEKVGEKWEWPEHSLVPVLFDINNLKK